MKKRVLCIFSIILCLLIVSTMLSFKIEDAMMTRVKTKQLTYTYGDIQLSYSALFFDDFGKHLFLLEEGTGWESGYRVVELDSNSYSVDTVRNLISFSTFISGHAVTTASRQPIPGTEVQIVEEGEWTPDELLLYYPFERTTSGSFPSGTTMLALSNDAMLLSAERTPQPYMEHQAKTWLIWQEMPMWRIFSLTEVRGFLDNMPLVALLAAMILLGIMVWGYSCVLVKDPWENRVPLWINLGIGAVIMCCLPFVLKAINLPWSMLPADNILDLSHYQSEFGMLTSALKGLGDCSQAVGILRKMDTAANTSIGILIGGFLCGVGVIVAEMIMIRRKKKLES